jgi:hypothetical protein
MADPRAERDQCPSMCLTLGLVRCTSTGHDRLDIVFGDLLRLAD